jgi:hypothetical protein
MNKMCGGAILGIQRLLSVSLILSTACQVEKQRNAGRRADAPDFEGKLSANATNLGVMSTGVGTDARSE